MCAVSNLGDYYRDRNKPWVQPYMGPNYMPDFNRTVSRTEFELLKRELEELKTLLKAAKVFDEVTKQPNCEQEDKIAFIRKAAELLGVDLEDIFGPIAQ